MSTDAFPGGGDYDAGRHGRMPFASPVVLGFPLDLDLDGLDQPEPGVFRWRNPAGRTHPTYPTRYII